ncbi:hypothetical protein [Burkholderia gladioli]|uniref:hypothetical protein n=1 Tax=Burkholderia gladioli TaxID=28095 RepID=UPI0016416E28|nr:hypothetical protein [Burkholderia gladioli]
MKVILLTALDGSKWQIPADVIVADRATSYLAEFKGDEAAARADSVEYFEDDYALTDWAQNNMNWSDVRAHAEQVSGPEKLDMQDSWVEGDLTVIDVVEPQRAAEPLPAEGIAGTVVFEPAMAELCVYVDGTQVVSIRQDGAIEICEGVTVDEAARAFWSAVQGHVGIRRPQAHAIAA